MAPNRGIVVFSGGSAANSLVDVFESIRRSSFVTPSSPTATTPSNTRLARSSSIINASSSPLSYIIPISDNGGSSSELIRVFGGPGIGDVRSRLVRLIPREPYSKEREAIRELLSWRLSGTDSKSARDGWNEIVDGTSHLWKGISSAKKELIRSFFNLINLEILKRSRPPGSTFDFRSASVGNLFLTGARLFSGSFESAIYLLAVVCGIPSSVADENEGVKVIPSVNSNFSHHIAAELEDGQVVVGQNAISHPSSEVQSPQQQRNHANYHGHGRVTRGSVGETVDLNGVPAREKERSDENNDAELANNDRNGSLRSNSVGHWEDLESQQEEEDAHPPFTLPTLRTRNITFTKAAHELSELPERIRRIYYINSFGQEILPPANPRMITAINSAKAIIYSIGSLYTSIVPSLILRGTGEAMRKSTAKVKILILNGSLDREVGPVRDDRPFTAIDFVDGIVRACEQSRGVVWDSDIPNRDRFDAEELERHDERLMARPDAVDHDRSDKFRGVFGQKPQPSPAQRQIVASKLFPPPMLASTANSRAPSPSPSPSNSPTRRSASKMPSSIETSSRSSSKPEHIYRNYVTHMIHLPNTQGTPYVDRDTLVAKGIKCIEVPGKANIGGEGMLYGFEELKSTIEKILIAHV